MLASFDLTFWILTILILFFTCANGFNDGCNAVATLIASRAMKPRPALIFASVMELLFPMTLYLTGFGVLDTIQSMVSVPYLNGTVSELERSKALAFIAAGIVAAISWNMFNKVSGIPASSTHSLIGGIVGAGLAAFYGTSGINVVAWRVFFIKVVLMIFIAPIVGVTIGFLVMKLLEKLTAGAGRKINTFYKYAQYVNMTFLTYSHSTHDSQKSMGIIMILVGIYGGSTHISKENFASTWWIVVASGLAMAIGIAFGGFKIIKTVGMGIFKVQPIHSFASQFASSVILITMNKLGAPVSASHVVSSTIMGVGSAERISAVRWSNVKRMIISWFITLPIVGSIGAVFYFIAAKFIFKCL